MRCIGVKLHYTGIRLLVLTKGLGILRCHHTFGSGRAYASADKTAREIELERELGELRRANELLKDAIRFSQKTGSGKGSALYVQP